MHKLLLGIVLFASSALGADITGSWSGEGVVRDESHAIYFVLKQDGATLSGSGGPDAAEQHPLENGKVDGTKIVFDVPTGKMTLHFELIADGDACKGTVEVRKEGEKETGTVSLKKVVS